MSRRLVDVLLTFSNKKAYKVITLFRRIKYFHHESKCKSYTKTYFKKSEVIKKTFYHIVLEHFNEYLPHFRLETDFLSFFNFQCPEFENIYILTTLHKTYKNHKKMNNASQTC